MKKLILLMLITFGAIQVQAQNKMLLNCEILKDNKKLHKNDNFKVTIIDNALNSKEILVNDKLLYHLEYNREYTILFEYNGCQAKSIYFNNYTNNATLNQTCYFRINLKESFDTSILHVAEVYYDSSTLSFSYKLLTKEL